MQIEEYLTPMNQNGNKENNRKLKNTRKKILEMRMNLDLMYKYI